jgi:hypothetical protein
MVERTCTSSLTALVALVAVAAALVPRAVRLRSRVVMMGSFIEFIFIDLIEVVDLRRYLYNA